MRKAATTRYDSSARHQVAASPIPSGNACLEVRHPPGLVLRGLVLVLAVLLQASPNARADAPPGRYSVLSATEVKDTKTGLVWSRAEEAGTFTWADAKTRCSAKGGSYRLPTIRELQSIVDETATTAPTIDKTVFSGVSGIAWSSTAYSLTAANAWGLNFAYGSTFNYSVSLTYNVRCVR